MNWITKLEASMLKDWYILKKPYKDIYVFELETTTYINIKVYDINSYNLIYEYENYTQI